jgi:hypothetical protein
MIIDFIGGTYEQKYKDWSGQKTINWYPIVREEPFVEKAKTPVALFPTPGLAAHCDLGGNIIRGLYVARSLTEVRCFAVMERSLYEIYKDGHFTLRGTMQAMVKGTTQKVYMRLNGAGELMIQDANAGYYFTLSTNVLTQITNIDYPGGTTLTYADGYFIISDLEGRVTFSELNSASQWSGVNVFTPTFDTDPVIAVNAIREEIHCFGSVTIEIYLNDGTTPFTRRPNTTLSYGIVAKDSLASHHLGEVFLGKNEKGETAVYWLGLDYKIQKISPPSINDQLSLKKGELDNCEAYIQYTPQGQTWYYLTVPALETTFVYDFSCQMWHERQSLRPFPTVDGVSPQTRFRGKCYAAFDGLNLFGDWYSGKIFREEYDTHTEAGLAITRQRRSTVYYEDYNYISVHSLEFDVNTGFGTLSGQGENPHLMIKFSRNGGNTFCQERYLALGKQGQYDKRCKLNKLGTARNWVLDASLTDPVPCAVLGVSARGIVSGGVSNMQQGQDAQ